jgi:hypothetical protein
MKSHLASLINAIALIFLGSWAYLASDDPSVTALIPVFAGIILLLLYKGVKAGNKVSGHIAVVITLLILGGLVKPLMGALDRADDMAISRVGIMMLTSLYSLIIFVREFIRVRRAK